VLILDRVLALSDKEAELVKAFAGRGGTVIADYLTGVFDENCKGMRTGKLDDLFNIKRDESKGFFNGRTFSEIDAERYQEPFLKRLNYDGAVRFSDIVVPELGTAGKNESGVKVNGAEALIKNSYRKGKTVYLNLSPVEYTDFSRRTSKYGENLREQVKILLKESGITPKLEIKEKDGSPVNEALFWKNGKIYYLCIVKNLSRYGGDMENGFGRLDGLKNEDTVIELTFNKRVEKIINLRTGKALGKGSKFTDEFKDYEANIYQLEFAEGYEK
jgi:hypothetical protein